MTSIGATSFRNNSLKQVIVPDNVTALANGMFANNPVKTIKFGSSLTKIGQSGFDNNHNTSTSMYPNKNIYNGKTI